MVSNTDLAFLALTLVALNKRKKEKRKRRWSKEWYKMRNRFSHDHLIRFLRISEPDDYRNFLRMDGESFDYLLELVRSDIEKKDTNMREAIPASQRLSITLRYLASGADLEDLKFTCAIAPQTLESIIMETCSAITKALKNNIQVPKLQDGWDRVSRSSKNNGISPIA
ncbi:uncharacterized protein [Leptinotarsa decemlineata]|uniref:uncharacterized protein n=1 Tax=Leptinotarsa decemlineata TaxID=7539 RepID=UPI003D30D1CE